jgi:hypothetical protein
MFISRGVLGFVIGCSVNPNQPKGTVDYLVCNCILVWNSTMRSENLTTNSPNPVRTACPEYEALLEAHRTTLNLLRNATEALKARRSTGDKDTSVELLRVAFARQQTEEASRDLMEHRNTHGCMRSRNASEVVSSSS